MGKRITVVLTLLVVLGSCGGAKTTTLVLPESVRISHDRRTIAVETAYPLAVGCAKEPAGLDVDVDGNTIDIRAAMGNLDGADSCTLECAGVTQSIALDEPLPGSVEFRFPGDTDPGCGRGFDTIREPSVVWDD